MSEDTTEKYTTTPKEYAQASYDDILDLTKDLPKEERDMVIEHLNVMMNAIGYLAGELESDSQPKLKTLTSWGRSTPDFYL